jgi:ferredoxin
MNFVEVKMQKDPKMKNPAKWVESIIRDFINRSPENTLKNPANEKAWADPLVGFSRGDDPLYQSYKEHVGPFHWTPLELFNLAFPQSKAGADQLTIISWVLPQTEQTKADLRKETTYPSESWARARIFGEEVNVKLRKHVAATLEASGIEAVAPMLFSQWTTKMSDRFGFASTWSERHAAHASGLGTFGLTDGLITPLGQAMRCGSVIARIQIPPTPRPYKDHHAYCLFYSRGTCGKCIQRCPANAVTKSGHDKLKCRAYLDMTKTYVPAHFGFEGYGCGFCQSGTPCESRIPVAEDAQ